MVQFARVYVVKNCLIYDRAGNYHSVEGRWQGNLELYIRHLHGCPIETFVHRDAIALGMCCGMLILREVFVTFARQDVDFCRANIAVN